LEFVAQVPQGCLLAAARRHGFPISYDDLAECVETNDKQRFAFDVSGELIRANQGHSAPVDLQLEEREPPQILYHGTVERFLPSILRDGLIRGTRHHVHLSPDYASHAWAGAWVNCRFRNESPHRSSDLIRQAIAATRFYWPHVPPLGMVSFIDPAQIRRKRDPGRCYRKAGFREAGRTKGGLVALQLLPDEMPEPEAVRGSQFRLLGIAE
jgi:hypothetical protein